MRGMSMRGMGMRGMSLRGVCDVRSYCWMGMLMFG